MSIVSPETAFSMYPFGKNSSAPSRTIKFREIVSLIATDPKLAKDTELYRELIDGTKAKRDFKEKRFPAILNSGNIPGERAGNYPNPHAGCYQLDIDKINDPKVAAAIKAQLSQQPWTILCFISASYNVKALIQSIPPSEPHLQPDYWEAVTKAACAAICYPWDDSDDKVKGANGLWFMNADPEPYYNPSPEILNVDVIIRQPEINPADPAAGESTVQAMLDQISQHVGPPGSTTYKLRLKTAACLKALGWEFERVNAWWNALRPGEFDLKKYDSLSAKKFKNPWRTLEYAAKYGMGNHRDNPLPNDPPTADAEPPESDSDALRWVMTAGKTPRPKDGSTLNATKALRELGEEDHFRYNLWTQRVEYRGADFNDVRGIPKLILSIEKKFGRLGYTPGKEAIHSAIQACPAEYNPPQEAIKAIVWDGIKRLDTFGHHAYGCDRYDPLANLTAALIIRGMVARLFRPGTRLPYIIILRSDKQGVGKGDSLIILAGGEANFGRGIQFGGFDFTKKIQERGRGKLIIEINEIHKLTAEKLSQAKALATDTSTNDRDAYARNNRDHPFTWIPVGTTNDRRFLTDLTGNRRHPVIDVQGPVNLQWIRDNRDQLLAEAYAEFLNGDFDNGVMLPEELWEDASEDSDQYQVEDPYDVWVDGYLSELDTAAVQQDAPEIAGVHGKQLMQACKDSMGSVDYQRLSEAMRRAGWVSRRVKSGGRQGRQITVWQPE